MGACGDGNKQRLLGAFRTSGRHLCSGVGYTLAEAFAQAAIALCAIITVPGRVQPRQLKDELAAQGVLVRSPSGRGIAEEAPGACKDVAAVVRAAHAAGLARRVAKLVPMICIKG